MATISYPASTLSAVFSPGELNPLQDTSGGKKISINNLGIKAADFALRKVPQCNRSWMNDFIWSPSDADKKGLGTIAEVVKQLAQKA